LLIGGFGEEWSARIPALAGGVVLRGLHILAEQLQLFDRFGRQGVADVVVFPPEFPSFTVPVEEFGRPHREDFQFEVVSVIVPRLQHLARKLNGSAALSPTR
jgi:hypothetical protein